MPPLGRGRGRPSRSEVLDQLTHAMDDMRVRFGGLPSTLEAEHIWRDIWREEARQHDIATFAGGMRPPAWADVPSAMATWLERVNALRDEGEPLPIRGLAATHAMFERIHPFLDGNGRAGRLVLNLTLVRLGMPPAIIYNRERTRYLRALARSDAGDDGALTELIARAVLNNLHRLMLPALAGPVRLVPLAALVRGEVSHGALRSAAARGALRAQRDPMGQWMSSQAFVDEYLAGRGLRVGRPKRPPN